MPYYHFAIACFMWVSIPLSLAADLWSVYQEAKSYDSAFAAAQAAHRAGQEKLAQSNAQWLPQINFSANYGRAQQRVNPGVPKLPYLQSEKFGRNYGYGITATQPLINATAMVNATQLDEQYQLAEVAFRDAEQTLILRVANAYFDVLLAQDMVSFVRSRKQAVAQQLAQAKKSFEVGVATITDTHEAQADFDQIVADEITAENELAVKKNSFSQITGLSADYLALLAESMQPAPPQPNDLNHWLSLAESNNLKIQSGRAELAIKNADIERYRAMRQPQLALEGAYQDNYMAENLSVQGSTDKKHDASIRLVLNIPLFRGGAIRSQLREAIAIRDQTQFTLENTRREIAQNTKQTFWNIQSGAAKINALEQALISAQSSVDSTKLGYEVGVRTLFDVLKTEAQLFSVRRDLAQAKYQYVLNRLQLANIVGKLGEQDVRDINTQLAQRP